MGINANGMDDAQAQLLVAADGLFRIHGTATMEELADATGMEVTAVAGGLAILTRQRKVIARPGGIYVSGRFPKPGDTYESNLARLPIAALMGAR